MGSHRLRAAPLRLYRADPERRTLTITASGLRALKESAPLLMQNRERFRKAKRFARAKLGLELPQIGEMSLNIRMKAACLRLCGAYVKRLQTSKACLHTLCSLT